MSIIKLAQQPILVIHHEDPSVNVGSSKTFNAKNLT